MALLSEKLNSITGASESEKENKVMDFEKNVRILEDKYEEMVTYHNRIYNTIKDQIARINRLVEDERNHRELVLETKLKEIIELDQKFDQAVLAEEEVTTISQRF